MQIWQLQLFADQRAEWEDHEARHAYADYAANQSDNGRFFENDDVQHATRGSHNAQGRELALAFVHRRGEYGEQHDHTHHPDHGHEHLEVGDQCGQRGLGIGGDAAGIHVAQIGESGVNAFDVLGHGLRLIPLLDLDHHGGDGLARIFHGHDLLGDLGRCGDHVGHSGLVDEHRIVEAGAGIGQLSDHRPFTAV